MGWKEVEYGVLMYLVFFSGIASGGYIYKRASSTVH